jgi:hypothetical protein
MSEPPPTRNFAAPNPDRRDALLARLRERGRALAPERIADIVKPRARGGA